MNNLLKKCFSLTLGFVLLFAFSAPAFSAVGFGIKGGFTLANRVSEPDNFEGYPFKSKMGLVGGVFVNKGIARGFSIQPELLYVQKGAKITVPEEDAKVDFIFDYIEIPLLLKYSFSKEGSKLIPSVFAGTFFGLSTARKMKITVGPDSETEDLKEDTKSSEFGLTFGAGFDWPLGSGRIVVDARFDLGLTDIVKPEVEEPSYMKTRTWLFMIGYSF